MHQLLAIVRRYFLCLSSTPLHPQWLSLQYHTYSRRALKEISGLRVLDIGSGDSRNEILLGPSCELYRLDYPATNVLYGNLPDIYADAHSLPVRNGVFDVVLLLEVLEHIPDDRRVLHEIERILKPGGRLYMSIPFIYPMHDEPTDFRRYTVYGLRHILNMCEFKIDHEIHHGNSFVAVAQLFNLSLLELVRDFYGTNRIVALLLAIIFYPCCILANLFAWPFLFLKKARTSCLGYFVTAVKK